MDVLEQSQNRKLRILRPLSHGPRGESPISARSCAVGSAYPNALRVKAHEERV